MSSTPLDTSVSANKFVTALSRDYELSPLESTLLRRMNVRSWEELYSLVVTFPSLAKEGLRLGQLRSYCKSNVSMDFTKRVEESLTSPTRHRFATGALPLVSGRHTVPMELATVVVPNSSARTALISPRIDLRKRGWPVKDQKDRETCVAFAVAALVEHELVVAGGVPPDLSEQFLYWAIKSKSGDPNKGIEGTLLTYGSEALSNEGLCKEVLWKYVPEFRKKNISQGAPDQPSQAAIVDASSRRRSSGKYKVFSEGETGGAALLLKFLQNSKPVAINMPIFEDSAAPANTDNWRGPIGVQLGIVHDPPPGATRKDNHAVCVVGFEPDQSEARGGYFIVRNSWGTAWGEALPSPAKSYAPEPGYGQISASYIDSYVVELRQL